MFCSKCGTQLDDGVTFCPNCGKSVTTVSVGATGAKASASAFIGKTAQFTKSIDWKNPKTLAIAGVAAVLVLVLLFSLFFGGSQSYEESVNLFMDGVVNCNGNKVIKAFPSQFIDFIEDIGASRSHLVEYLNEELEWAFGSSKYSYEITGTESLDRYDLEEVKDNHKHYYDITVKDAKIVHVELKENGYSFGSYEIRILVIKVGDSWYVSPNAMESII